MFQIRFTSFRPSYRSHATRREIVVEPPFQSPYTQQTSTIACCEEVGANIPNIFASWCPPLRPSTHHTMTNIIPADAHGPMEPSSKIKWKLSSLMLTSSSSRSVSASNPSLFSATSQHCLVSLIGISEALYSKETYEFMGVTNRNPVYPTTFYNFHTTMLR